MIGAAARRSVPLMRRQVGVQRRTMFDRPNTIIEQQKAMQKGQTPYLRGDADPT